MSIGAYIDTYPLLLHQAVTYAYNSGVTLIASAGNEGPDVPLVPHYPGAFSECICISAIRYDYDLAPYSNYGPDIDFCAPGGDITVDQNYDGYGDGILQQTHNGVDYTSFDFVFKQGTSSACALVSGVAALVISNATVPLIRDKVKSILVTSAIDDTAWDATNGIPGKDEKFGYGLVNAYLALIQTP